MAENGTTTPRERYRAQVRTEIKDRAWEQIATAGASALSLNAIAKQMGLSGPALYRYYAGRDDLITELIRDAYRSLADALGAAAARSGAQASGAAVASDVGGTGDTRGAARPEAGAGAGLAALAYALRDWALDDPHRYFLVYGTPVPGYHAPDDTTEIASEIMAAVLDAATALPPARPATPFAAHLETHGRWAHGHPAPPTALHRALTFWTRLHGVLSLELAGQFTGMGFEPAALFAAELDDLLTR